MSLPTASSKYTVAVLYKLPTLSQFDGQESVIYVNPKFVQALTPETITIGHESSDSKEVKGTYVLVSSETIFVAMTPAEVALLLDIELVG